jgi:hypothetical protein
MAGKKSMGEPYRVVMKPVHLHQSRRSLLQGRLLLLALALGVSCGGKLQVDQNEPGAGAAGTALTNPGDAVMAGATSDAGGSLQGESGSATQGGASASAGSTHVGGPSTSTAGDDDGVGGSRAAGGASDVGAGAAGMAGDAAVSCTEAADPAGDCHSCSEGPLPTRQVDQSDVPTPQNQCLAGTCNALGAPGSEPRDARATCHDDAGGAMCDGKGQCVRCLKTSDCPAQQSCAKDGTCGPAPCTDVDCGGACPTCDVGKKCLIDADCASGACDSETLTCVADHCKDHHQDFGETDADCGVTGNCGPCKLDQGCYWNIDCVTQACDGISAKCISNQCADHHVDGDESDVDCGGGYCPGCPLYKKCKNSFDCADGTCSLSLPHLCQ